MLTGMTVNLSVKTQIGVDAFNRPIYSEDIVPVENVLVSPASEQEILDTLNLTGRKAVYQLAIPKGDTHTWENTTVFFFGQSWRTIGLPIEGIPSLIPLNWNRKVRVERVE